MNAYSFPDTVIISEPAKNLITRILNLDPTKRPKLDEILTHNFFKLYSSIPKNMPNSTLACPPPATLMKQYQLTYGAPTLSSSAMPVKLESTAPININQAKSTADNMQPNFNHTEKIKLDPHKHVDKPKEEEKSVPKSIADGCAGWIWVKKWVDYSSKYGLGYMLTSGTTGVFYNDSTKIILSKDEQ